MKGGEGVSRWTLVADAFPWSMGLKPEKSFSDDGKNLMLDILEPLGILGNSTEKALFLCDNSRLFFVLRRIKAG